jgi:hypothetical protein
VRKEKKNHKDKSRRNAADSLCHFPKPRAVREEQPWISLQTPNTKKERRRGFWMHLLVEEKPMNGSLAYL